jgi:hypothetical protein
MGQFVIHSLEAAAIGALLGQLGRYQGGEADQEGLRRRLPFGDRNHSGGRRRSDCPRGVSTAPRTCAPSIRPLAARRRHRSRTVRDRCASARSLPLGYRRLGQHEVKHLPLRWTARLRQHEAGRLHVRGGCEGRRRPSCEE